MSSLLSPQEEKNAKMLVSLREVKGVKGLLNSGKFKFDIAPSRNGARILASLDLDGLNEDLHRFALKAFSGQDKVTIERAGEDGCLKNQITYRKEVGENYLTDENLQLGARKHVAKTFIEPLNNSVQQLKEEVRNPGFPGTPLSAVKEPLGKTNKGAVGRFIDRIPSGLTFG